MVVATAAVNVNLRNPRDGGHVRGRPTKVNTSRASFGLVRDLQRASAAAPAAPSFGFFNATEQMSLFIRRSRGGGEKSRRGSHKTLLANIDNDNDDGLFPTLPLCSFAGRSSQVAVESKDLLSWSFDYTGPRPASFNMIRSVLRRIAAPAAAAPIEAITTFFVLVTLVYFQLLHAIEGSAL